MADEEQRVRRIKDGSGVTRFVQAGIAPTEANYLQSLETVAADVETLRIVTFYLNGQEYAFEVADAVEVLKPRAITEVPRVPSYILGVLSVRGEMVSIMNLKKRLKVDAGGDTMHHARILVAGDEELRTGFLVDGMGGVKELSSSSVVPDKNSGGLIRGVVHRGSGAPITLLDVDKLINP